MRAAPRANLPQPIRSLLFVGLRGRGNEMVEQSTDTVVMIRPNRFYPNPETALDNAFQQTIDAAVSPEVEKTAQAEFDRAVAALSAAA